MKPWTLSLMALLLIGCGGGARHERLLNADGRRVGVSTLTTSLAPKETLRRAATVCKRLELTGGSGGGLFGWGGDSDIDVKSDRYSATATAKTAAGETINLTAKLVSETRTELTVRSDLVDAQHRDLVKQIQAGIAAQPAAK